MRGETPLRYYTVDWPATASPAVALAGTAPSSATGVTDATSSPAGRPSADPKVRVLVADSNTLDVAGGVLGGADRIAAGTDVLGGGSAVPGGTARTAGPRSDALQLLWIENQLRTAPADAWTLVVMHHPPYSPRGCVFRFVGQCIGGHADESALHEQLRSAWGASDPYDRSNGAHHPDLVFAAHNHFYARTRSVDGLGYPTLEPGAGVRYFVTGGGGAPLYRPQPLHARYAAGGAFHHFVYLRLRPDTAFFWAIDDRGQVRDSGCFRRGEALDRCIASGTFTSAALTCGEPAPASGCPAPSR